MKAGWCPGAGHLCFLPWLGTWGLTSRSVSKLRHVATFLQTPQCVGGLSDSYSISLDTPPPCFLSEDVEDELIKEDLVLSPPLSMLKLQTVSKPIDLSLAKVGVHAEAQGVLAGHT